MTKNFLREFQQDLRREGRERTLGYIIGAFGLVAGLAWNDAVKVLIETLFPVKANSILAKFSYAAIMTVIAVVAAAYMTSLFKKKEKTEEKIVEKK